MAGGGCRGVAVRGRLRGVGLLLCSIAPPLGGRMMSLGAGALGGGGRGGMVGGRIGRMGVGGGRIRGVVTGGRMVGCVHYGMAGLESQYPWLLEERGCDSDGSWCMCWLVFCRSPSSAALPGST